MMKFHYSEEVKIGLSSGLPIVVLESTIISHGMPYPDNLHTAREVEEVVRSNGAVPATIAVVLGSIHIGLSESHMEIIAKAGSSCVKCSRRNLPYVLSKKLNGSTTVAATMYLASMAGLKIFVTGGIGGVHRGAEETWDVSGDLVELGRTPITVICAGAKSILDIPKTLEYLETQGVPVIGYKTSNFPAFFSPSSGCEVMCRLDSPAECADFIKESEGLRLNNGTLIAVALSEEELAKNAETAIQVALAEAKDQGIKGAQVTPFLLKRVNELSEGESLKANIALIKQNAKIGSLIACEYYKSETITVIGGITLDTICFSNEDPLIGGENSGRVATSAGGVGFNLYKSCRQAGAACNFITTLGNDAIGSYLQNELQNMSNNSQGIFTRTESSNQYIGIISRTGELERAVIDKRDIEFSPTELEYVESQIKKSKLVVIDLNIAFASLIHIIRICENQGVKLLLEPTADWCCKKIIENGFSAWGSFKFITPNTAEIKIILGQDGEAQVLAKNFMEKYPQTTLLLKDGKNGVWLCENGNTEKFEINPAKINNVTGAGDLLVGILAAGIVKGEKLENTVRSGIKEVEEFLSSAN